MLIDKQRLMYLVQSHKSKWSVHKNGFIQIKTSEFLSGMLDAQYNTGEKVKSKIGNWCQSSENNIIIE